jgi:hypothetical protein
MLRLGLTAWRDSHYPSYAAVEPRIPECSTRKRQRYAQLDSATSQRCSFYFRLRHPVPENHYPSVVDIPACVFSCHHCSCHGAGEPSGIRVPCCRCKCTRPRQLVNSVRCDHPASDTICTGPTCWSRRERRRVAAFCRSAGDWRTQSHRLCDSVFRELGGKLDDCGRFSVSINDRDRERAFQRDFLCLPCCGRHSRRHWGFFSQFSTSNSLPPNCHARRPHQRYRSGQQRQGLAVLGCFTIERRWADSGLCDSVSLRRGWLTVARVQRWRHLRKRRFRSASCCWPELHLPGGSKESGGDGCLLKPLGRHQSLTALQFGGDGES